MDKLRTYSHDAVPRNQQPMNRVIIPTTVRALVTVHVGSIKPLTPTRGPALRGNTRNHVKSDLEVTCKMVAWNSNLWTSGCGKSTWASLALQSQIGICIESSFFHVWADGVLGKATAQNHQEQPPPGCNLLCKVCLL